MCYFLTKRYDSEITKYNLFDSYSAIVLHLKTSFPVLSIHHVVILCRYILLSSCVYADLGSSGSRCPQPCGSSCRYVSQIYGVVHRAGLYAAIVTNYRRT